MRKRFFVLAIALLLSLSLTGTALAADKDRQVVIVSAWEASGMDPVTAGFVFIRSGCLETLLTSDRKGGIEPRLATGWSISDDGLTWTFNLRSGVFFHDGTPMTGDVAAASLNRTMEKGTVFKGTPVKEFRGEGMKVIVETSRPFSALPAYLVHNATSICAPSSFDGNGKAIDVIGTGPYKMTSFKEGKIIDFEAFDKYWGRKASISRERYFAVPNPETRAMLAESGEGDIVVDLPAEAGARLAKNKNLTVISQPLPRVRLLVLNSKLPFFSSPSMRRAISLMIDRKGIAASLLKNPKAAAAQLFPPVASWYNDELVPLEYNPEKGRAILKKEGWLPGKDGNLEKNGQPLSFEILTYASRPDLPLVAEVIQQEMKEQGITVNIEIAKSGMILTKHEKGTLETGIVARNFGFVADPIGTVASDFGPLTARGGYGAMSWESESFNKAVKDYFSTFDKEGQKILQKKMTTILQQELPVLPLAWYDNFVSVNKRIKGIELDPSEQRPYAEGAEWSE